MIIFCSGHFPRSSVDGWFGVYSSVPNSLCGPIEERLNHFLSHWLRVGWRSVINQRSLKIVGHGCIEIEPEPPKGCSPAELSCPEPQRDRQWETFTLPLSYHDPGHGEDRQWNRFILPLGNHDPGHREDREIHSFSPWAMMTRTWSGRWDTFILPESYHDCLSFTLSSPKWSQNLNLLSVSSIQCPWITITPLVGLNESWKNTVIS